jgi:hypothetical protein
VYGRLKFPGRIDLSVPGEPNRISPLKHKGNFLVKVYSLPGTMLRNTYIYTSVCVCVCVSVHVCTFAKDQMQVFAHARQTLYH